MKIAILNGYQNARGAETFILELSKRLSERHKVVLMQGSKKAVVRWPIIWRFFLDPHGIYTFTFTLKNLFNIFAGKFDVVIPINGGWQPALVRIITRLYGGKMVISGQSGLGWDDKNNLWCFPDSFVALSSFARNWARKVNPWVNVDYIPNGVDLEKFKPEGNLLKINLPRPVVLTVGALTPSKRIDLTVRAVAKLRNMSLLVIGDGELRNDILKLGEELLGKRFCLLKLPFEKMPEAYRAADLFTLVSEPRHSFEIALVEAMATNLPVVANGDPIRKEIVGNAGILVNNLDLDLYAKAISRTVGIKWQNKPRIQSSKFSWNDIARSYENLFTKLVSNN